MPPLVHGYSHHAIGKNIGIELKHGKPRAQAVAIAFDEARKAFRSRHPGKPLPSHLRPVKKKRRTSRRR